MSSNPSLPIAAGPWRFRTSEALYQATKFPSHPDIQQRIAEASTARESADIGRTPGVTIHPAWSAHRVDVMRWVLRMKREANADEIDAVLATTAERPIVEASTRDVWWGAQPVADRYEGRNVLGCLWMEVRQQLRVGDPAACSGTRSAAATGVPASGAGPGDWKSNSVVCERSVGAARSIDPVFCPSNGKTHTNRAPVDPGLFSPPLWYNTGQLHLLPT